MVGFCKNKFLKVINVENFMELQEIADIAGSQCMLEKFRNGFQIQSPKLGWKKVGWMVARKMNFPIGSYFFELNS